jgi:hypothetical protein
MKAFKTKKGCFFGEYMVDEDRDIQYKLLMSRHALDRAKERLHYMGIRFDSEEQYYDLAIDFCLNALSHRYMRQYLNNMVENRISTRILVRDQRTGMVCVIAVNPYNYNLYCVTYGSDKEKTWITSHDLQRRCWIHDDNTMVFSTATGNTVWSPECESFKN